MFPVNQMFPGNQGNKYKHRLLELFRFSASSKVYPGTTKLPSLDEILESK